MSSSNFLNHAPQPSAVENLAEKYHQGSKEFLEVLSSLDFETDVYLVSNLVEKYFQKFPFNVQVLSEILYYDDLHPALYKIDYGKFIKFFFDDFLNSNDLEEKSSGLYNNELQRLVVDKFNNLVDVDSTGTRTICAVEQVFDALNHTYFYSKKYNMLWDGFERYLENPIFKHLERGISNQGASSDYLLAMKWLSIQNDLSHQFDKQRQNDAVITRDNKKQLFFCLVAWGDSIAQANDFCLDSLINSKNFKKLNEIFELKFVIYSTSCNLVDIEFKGCLDAIASFDYEVLYFSGDDFRDLKELTGVNYKFSSFAHNDFVAYARTYNASVVFLTPDAVYGDSLSEGIIQSYNENRIYAVSSPRTVREKFEKTTENSDCLKNHLKSNFHDSNFNFSNSKKTASGLPGVFTEVIGHDLNVYSFHPHPLFIPNSILQKNRVGWFESIDGDFVSHLYSMCKGSGKEFNDIVNLHNNYESPVMIDLTSEIDHISPEEMPISHRLNAPETNSFIRRLSEFHICAFSRPGRVSDVFKKDQTVNVAANLELLKSRLKQKKKFNIGVNKTEYKESSLVYSKNNDKTEGKSNRTVNLKFYGFIWGKVYISEFLEYSLPSFFGAYASIGINSQSNISFEMFLGVPKSEIEEFTKRVNQKNVCGIKISYMAIDELIDLSNTRNKYKKLTALQNSVLNQQKPGEYIGFLYSDFIWSSNSLRYLCQLIGSKTNCIFQFIPQVNKDDFLIDLTKNYKDLFQFSEGIVSSFNINEVELVGLAKKHLHKIVSTSIHNSENFNPVGPYFILKDNNSNMVVRAFHLHPTIIKIPERMHFVDSSYDEEFINANFDVSECHVIRNTDEIFICSLESKGKFLGESNQQKLNQYGSMLEWQANWARNSVKLQHFSLFQEEIIFGDEFADEHGHLRDRSLKWKNLLFFLIGTDIHSTNGNSINYIRDEKKVTTLSVILVKILMFIENMVSSNMRKIILDLLPQKFRRFISNQKRLS